MNMLVLGELGGSQPACVPNVCEKQELGSLQPPVRRDPPKLEAPSYISKQTQSLGSEYLERIGKFKAVEGVRRWAASQGS